MDTFRHTNSFFWQNNLILFFNIHEKCVLYQFKKIFSPIHWCCQQNIIYFLKYFRICISKSFMRPQFFWPPFITVHCSVQYCLNGLNFGDITKSDDAASGSDAGSENVYTVVGGQVEGGYTSKGKKCKWTKENSYKLVSDISETFSFLKISEISFLLRGDPAFLPRNT